MSTAPLAIDLPIADRIPAELEADTNAILAKLLTGQPLAPEVYSRIRAQADAIRDELYRQHGLLDIGVPAIRELRDGR